MLSVLGIFMAVTINLIEIVQKKTPSLLPSLIALSISIFGISRSGLITSLIYFVSFYLLLYWTKDIKYKMIFAFLMAVLIYFTFQNLDFIRTMDFYTKLEKAELGLSGRDLLWNEYLQNINFTTFLLGYDYTKNALISSFNNNPHNSWISFHASMGVFSIYIMLTLLLSLFHFFHKNKFIFILLLAVILRSLTDTFLFFGKFDYIIIIFCFHILDPRFKK